MVFHANLAKSAVSPGVVTLVYTITTSLGNTYVTPAEIEIVAT